MSLTDLKKRTKQPVKRSKVSVDQFIEDADNYAQGKTSASNKPLKNPKATTNFRHCTFTFDASAIAHLQQASEQHKVAKSKLLRLLLKQFDSLSPQQQQALLAESKER
ncbi:replication protein RepA [Agarivorans aestuarii]|uniref:Replication protein RepA n=1 Tax=Agarivorans aestuarii TaxID=1563703 RepID=A0ABU7G7N1_9ALTE|nr:replication protein RepA [Agarivorans aestuarii]MEE1675227.1 replication protein RepA [Agarivorans aestuarii]